MDEDDYRNNDQSFNILEGVFDDDIDQEDFNSIADKWTKVILDTAYLMYNTLLYSDIPIVHANKKICTFLKRFSQLPTKRQTTLKNKVRRTIAFAEKEPDKFKNNIKQVLLNAINGKTIGKRIRFSRHKDDYCKKQKGEYRVKKLLYYEPFLFVIDALEMYGIIQVELGDHDKETQSTMWLTEYGEKLFSSIISSLIRFKKIEKQDLIILKDKINGRDVVIPYGGKTGRNEPKHIVENKNRLKIYNRKYQKADMKVFFDDATSKPIELDIHFLEFLNHYWRNCSIDINSLKIELVDCDNIIDEYYENLITTLLSINNSISINFNNNNNHHGILWNKGPLEGKKSRKGFDNKMLYPQKQDACTCKILVHKIDVTLIKKDLYRVYSRGKWSMHGRFYGGIWQNLNKKLRKHIYINGSNCPYTNWDFSAMHIYLSYHLNNKPCKGNPYIIDNYGLKYTPIFKTLGLVALNAKNIHEAIGAGKNKLKEAGFDMSRKEVEKLLSVFMNHHKDIHSCFCNDSGIRYMNVDSTIMDSCIREIQTNNGIIVLPVHDELLCPGDAQTMEFVKKQMIKFYKKVVLNELNKQRCINNEESLQVDINPHIHN